MFKKCQIDLICKKSGFFLHEINHRAQSPFSRFSHFIRPFSRPCSMETSKRETRMRSSLRNLIIRLLISYFYQLSLPSGVRRNAQGSVPVERADQRCAIHKEFNYFMNYGSLLLLSSAAWPEFSGMLDRYLIRTSNFFLAISLDQNMSPRRLKWETQFKTMLAQFITISSWHLRFSARARRQISYFGDLHIGTPTHTSPTNLSISPPATAVFQGTVTSWAVSLSYSSTVPQRFRTYPIT